MKLPLLFGPTPTRLFAAGLLLGTALPSLAQNFGAMIPYALGSSSGPLGIALADLNGDGRLDLLAGNGAAQTVSVLLGLGNGTLGPPAAFPTSAGAVALKVGDVNRDGRPDVVVADGNWCSLLLGMPNGTLTPPMAQFALNVTSNPGALALGDVNGDGLLDIVTAYGASTTSGKFDQAIVLLGRATSTFAPPVAYSLAVGSHPEAVALSDVNGDGRPDIAVASIDNDAVQVLLNVGNGAFGPATSYGMGVGTGPLGMAVADVNGDGQPDLLTANHAGSVSVRLNYGGGQFGPAAVYPVGAAPVGIAVGDVNNDGFPDVLTAGFGSDQLSVLPGVGAGLFGQAINYSTSLGSSPISVTTGDMDGDGALDVVSANLNAKTAGVFLSQAPVLTLTGPASGGAGMPITLAGTRLMGATAVTFSRRAQVVATVPAARFTGTNYTGTPNTIGFVVPASLAAGTYEMAVVTPHGTSPATNFNVTVALAAMPRLRDEQVGVFPSPAHTSVTVQVPSMGGGVVCLHLRDALGRTVRTVEIALPAAGLRQELDLRGLAPGVYAVQVRVGAGTVTRRLLVD